MITELGFMPLMERGEKVLTQLEIAVIDQKIMRIRIVEDGEPFVEIYLPLKGLQILKALLLAAELRMEKDDTESEALH